MDRVGCMRAGARNQFRDQRAATVTGLSGIAGFVRAGLPQPLAPLEETAHEPSPDPSFRFAAGRRYLVRDVGSTHRTGAGDVGHGAFGVRKSMVLGAGGRTSDAQVLSVRPDSF